MILLQRTDWLLHLPTCMLFGLSKPRTRFLHPFWIILGHLRVPRCLSGPIQGKLTHGGSPGGCSCCFLSAARLLVPLWGGAILIFMKIRLVERHHPPEYNARYLPPNSFLRVIPEIQALFCSSDQYKQLRREGGGILTILYEKFVELHGILTPPV